MRKWEYLTVRMFHDEKDRPVCRKMNGMELPNWKEGPDLYTYLNHLLNFQ